MHVPTQKQVCATRRGFRARELRSCDGDPALAWLLDRALSQVDETAETALTREPRDDVKEALATLECVVALDPAQGRRSVGAGVTSSGNQRRRPDRRERRPHSHRPRRRAAAEPELTIARPPGETVRGRTPEADVALRGDRPGRRAERPLTGGEVAR